MTPRSLSLVCDTSNFPPNSILSPMLLNPKCITAHLSKLNSICQSWDQPNRLTRSLLNTSVLLRSNPGHYFGVISKLDHCAADILINIVNKNHAAPAPQHRTLRHPAPYHLPTRHNTLNQRSVSVNQHSVSVSYRRPLFCSIKTLMCVIR